VIVHSRGTNDSNLLIIEAKKEAVPDHTWDAFDEEKVIAYGRELRYLAGIQLYVRIGAGPGARFRYRVYHGGFWKD
jgi:hypothetical protein